MNRGNILKNICNKKGFTLIEVILSISIIGILSVVLLSCLPNNYKNIISSGTRTKSVFNAQEKIDKAIKNISVVDGDSQLSKQSETINIKFSNSDRNIISTGPITGNIVTSNSNDKKAVTIITFVPSR
ncbi:MAG: hypothetical protein ACFWUA_10025 [Sporanaerobacter sp.]|uniref:prepilin-type N-terminal cleavage/methylation domain-containing protein n=1 Tax=Sporanaerobacter sp. TaxID=2010183 RepID=UPI003A0FFE2E